MKLDVDDLMYYRDRFDVPLTDEQVRNIEYFRPDEKSPEIKYIKERRIKLGGYLPERSTFAKPIKAPSKDIFDFMKVSTGEKEMSTTMALVRMLTNLLRDKNISPRLVPIIPDEARTFGMEGFFQKIGIYAHEGQKYEPEDAAQLSSYREDKSGQVLEEGINEAGAMSSWIAAATAYTNHDIEMIPIYIFYSMFGFQRVGDLAWAAGDSQARGFLVGATAGRTTLAGEGLQHQDGHSHLISSTVPNLKSYDPAFAYEIAIIIQYGLKDMYEWQNNVFYYLTVENENYVHPPLPNYDIIDGVIKGMYCFKDKSKSKNIKVQLLGSGPMMNEVLKASEILSNDWNIDSTIWSVTSYSELHKEAENIDRWNTLHPNSPSKKSYLDNCLKSKNGPVIAVSDYVKLVAEQIAPYIDCPFVSLGTDGFGRSETRDELRDFFEVNKYYIVLSTINLLYKNGILRKDSLTKALKKYNIDTSKPNPKSI